MPERPEQRAIRVVLDGRVQGVGLRLAIRRRARELGLLGWVRNDDDGRVLLHAEGPDEALDQLLAFLRDGAAGAGAGVGAGVGTGAVVATGAVVEHASVEEVPIEGHEQFAIRGVSAGVFVVQEHLASAHHFDLRLEVAGVMRSWALPRGPSMDPAVKRLAVQVEDHGLDHNAFEGPTEHGGVIVWDRGGYEQGGRVPWPAALERGHGVFVLHGEKLRGGFALQRTRGTGPKAQWLLIKRRDEAARPGSDVVAEQAASVLSGRTLRDVRAG